MTKKESEETDETEIEETETEETEIEETDDDEEKGWARLQGMIDNSVKKGIEEWSGQQKKTTSTRSQRKPEKKTTPRKKGFLSSQFFSGLNPDE